MSLPTILTSLICTLQTVHTPEDLGKVARDIEQLRGIAVNAPATGSFDDLVGSNDVDASLPSGIQSAIETLRAVRENQQFCKGGAAHVSLDNLVSLGDQVRNYGAFYRFLDGLGQQFPDDTEVWFAESDDDSNLYAIAFGVGDNPPLVRRLLEVFGADERTLAEFDQSPSIHCHYQNQDRWGADALSMRDFADAITVEEGQFFDVVISIGEIRKRVAAMEEKLKEAGFRLEDLEKA